jgi:Arc/MetJ-type ribon-helix-helix transcriptional regulator
MTIHLPEDLERSIAAEVDRGRFATADDLVAQAVRSFLQAPSSRKKDAKTDYHRHLMEICLMSQLPNHEADADDSDEEPIDLPGEPLSQTIIRDRR